MGCFYVLDIVNTAAMNIEVHVYFSNQYFHFFPNIYPGEELMEQIVVIYLVFWGTSILFSIVDAPIYIPTNSVQ